MYHLDQFVYSFRDSESFGRVEKSRADHRLIAKRLSYTLLAGEYNLHVLRM
jgi:hypothetical protein